MRSVLVRGLRAFKWRLLVPTVYWLGLPHQQIADALRLSPVKQLLGRSNGEQDTEFVRPNAASDDPEARYPGPPRYSIYTASSVAATCRILRQRLGREAMEAYVEELVEVAPEYEPDVRAALVDNGWLEVDTVEELEVYEGLQREGRLADLCRLDWQAWAKLRPFRKVRLKLAA